VRTLFFATVLLISPISAVAAGAQTADLMLLNGRIHTLDPARPWAEAVAIAGDRIVAVGSSADVAARRGTATRVIDLRGRFALPGFNDAHVHIDATGSLLLGANLLDVHAAPLFRQRLAEAAARLPEGSWILRGDWGAYEQWNAGTTGAPGAPASPAAAPFMPNRDLIDAVTPKHPVLVNRFDRTVYLANSLALELAGIGDRTPNPEGGEIVRDPQGRATGILRGTAAQFIRKVIPPIPFEQRLAQVRAVLREAREGGVTTMQDLTSWEQLRAYQDLYKRGELTSRIMLRPTLDNVDHVFRLGLTQGFGNDWLKFVGYKAWVDGIMGNSSAMFFRPYDHDPKNKGQLRDIMRPESEPGYADVMRETDHYTAVPPGNLEKLLMAAVGTGLTPHVHAIGDKGNRIVLDIFARVLAPHGEMILKDHRWRVIHAQVVHPDDFARFGSMKLVAEVNPYHVSDDMRWMEERIGRERSKGAYAFRTLKDNGAVLIFGSDSPGTNAARYFLNPVYGLYAAVTRQTLTGEPRDGWFPGQRLTIEEAIEAYTKAPAWASFEEDRKGMLKEGFLADIAVFDGNLIEIGKTRPADLLKVKAEITIAGGTVVYTR
jgi:predicted amidohydrolase YtcJ